ncbi:MAG: hypothetical protein AAF518_26515 [Spirochaetota bacterium]
MEGLQEYRNAIAEIQAVDMPINDEFIQKLDGPIKIIRQFLEPKGGILLVEVAELQLLCRIPSRQILEEINKRIKNLDAFESDRLLLSRCLIYPSIDVVNGWVESGSPGVVSSASRKLLQEAKILEDATAKKF